LTYLLKDEVSGYAVQYPAGMGTQGQGTTDIVKHIDAQLKACPDQKFSLGGHSQGGFAVVDAVPKLSAEALKKVVAITMFGSPACPASVRNRCISYCNSGDSVRTPRENCVELLLITLQVCASRSGGPSPGLAAGEGGAPSGAPSGARAPKGSPKGAPKGLPKGGDTSAPPAEEAVVLEERDIFAVGGKAPNCASVDFSKTSGGGSGGHLGYNSNGLYVEAAACYTIKMYEKSKGKA
jgi:hypothetical protein